MEELKVFNDATEVLTDEYKDDENDKISEEDYNYFIANMNSIMDRNSDNRAVQIQLVSTEYATRLIVALSDYFSITIDKVLSIFDEIGYWKIINNDEVCCVLAHDGVQANIKDLERTFNEILSRN